MGRIYGIKSGRNNMNKFIARSYMYNSNNSNNNQPQLQQELKNGNNYDYEKKKRTEKRLIKFAIIYYILEMVVYELIY